MPGNTSGDMKKLSATRAAALRRPAWSAAWALAPLLLCGSDLHRAFGRWNEVAMASEERPALGDLADRG